MKVSRSCSSIWMAAALLLAVVAVPAAAKDVVQSGTDFWRTAGDGLTFTSFDKDPIPAGFFCPGSQPFTDRIKLSGGRLATEPAGSLGRVDTVVHRLNDVVLDENGVGLTPIKLLALALETREPIATSCGSYDVKVALAGEQSRTWMKIVKTSELGGTYAAPLALDVRVVFEPVAGNPNPRVELLRKVRLGPDDHAVWVWQDPGEHAAVKVDTDGDGTPDALLPQPSNFLAGVEPVALSGSRTGGNSWTLAAADGEVPVCPPGLCPYQSCHCNPDEDDWDPADADDGCDDDHRHCKWVCVQPGSFPGAPARCPVAIDEPIGPAIGG
jgi:hypothetical protein